MHLLKDHRIQKQANKMISEGFFFPKQAYIHKQNKSQVVKFHSNKTCSISAVKHLYKRQVTLSSSI